MARELPIQNGRLTTDLDADGHRINNLSGGLNTVAWSDVTGKPTFAAVATSGSYNDLSGKPTIPAAVTVDSALSTASTNPVQNKVVTAALDNKITPGMVEPQSNRLLTLLAFVKQNGITLPESAYTTYGVDGLLALKANSSDVTAALALKADVSSLPYALVSVTPTAGAPFVLAACFPIKYVTRDETEVTVTAENAQTLSISGGYVVHDGLTIFYCNSNGTFAGEAEVDSVTFGDPATPPTSSTQVLGFTPTYALADRTMNQVVVASPLPENGIALAFPAATDGNARDFVVRLTLTETDNVVPSVTFPADVAYETEGGEWPDLTEAGTYIVRLTEVPTAGESETARFFLQCSSAVADATPPSAGGAA